MGLASSLETKPFGNMSAVAVKNAAKTISFSEIVRGRDANVRVTGDNLLYAVDLAMVVTGKHRNYAGQVKSATFPSLA